MDYETEENGARTNAEQSETPADFRGSFVSRRGMVRPDLPIGSPERAVFFGLLRESFSDDWAEAKAALDRADRIAKGDLYFIRCGDYLKIGRTTNIAQRLANMQVNSPHTLDCLLLLRGRGHEEGDWHERFKADRVRGEWYRFTPELEAAVLDEREAQST